MKIDVQRIIGEVASKHGFALNPDDPLIALATVNSIVLEDVVRQTGEEISARIVKFHGTMDKLERRAGEALGQQAAKLITELRNQVREEIHSAVRESRPSTKRSWNLPIGALAGLVAFVLGVLVDRCLR